MYKHDRLIKNIYKEKIIDFFNSLNNHKKKYAWTPTNT